MTKYRFDLPQHSGKLCITDGGLETEFVFNKQVDLPEFASYDLLRSEQGYSALYDYFSVYAKMAHHYEVGLILETPSWRANPDWGHKIGDSLETLNCLNQRGVKLIEQLREQFETTNSPIVISGCIGPRGDGYSPEFFMTDNEAQNYHRFQISSFAETNVDMVAALTLNYVDEAIGVTLAAKEFDLPVCISFTVETNGQLPTGESLEHAIQAVDQATNAYPAYFMINCAHPTHFQHSLNNETCRTRLKGLRANASSCSHAELDEAEELDEGNPYELGKQFADILTKFPQINIIGGCCGTDHRHIEQIAYYCSRND